LATSYFNLELFLSLTKKSQRAVDKIKPSRMQNQNRYSPCPCDSKSPYDKCCRPYHQGLPAPTALALMRSRYCAYALGLVDYIIKTTHGQNPAAQGDHSAWRNDLLRFCEQTDFDGLKILQFEEGKSQSSVAFTAYLRQAGGDSRFSEKSLFRKEGGQWLYLSGEFLDK